MFSMSAISSRRSCGKILNDDWNFGQAGQPCCPPAAFARDQLIPITVSAHDQGLNNPVGPNGLRQLIQAIS